MKYLKKADSHRYIVANRGNEEFPLLLPTGYRPSVVGNLKVLKIVLVAPKCTLKQLK